MARSIPSLRLPARSSRDAIRGFRAALAALLLGAAMTPPAAAQDTPDDIYIGVIKDPKKIIVVFVFADSTQDAYTPKTQIALYADPEYKPAEGEKFNAQKGCVIAYGLPIGIPDEFKEKPVYGPNSGVDLVEPFNLPTFMANQVKDRIDQYDLAETAVEVVPTFNCSGYLWAGVIETSTSWDDIRAEVERRKQAQQQ